MIKDELDNVFICSVCGKECDITQGTFPVHDYEGKPFIVAMFNEEIQSSLSEFVCYDCTN